MPYQSTHNTGGTIMGTNPRNSAVNKYLQSWDCHNLFVVGANVFPHNAAYNPTGPVGALAYWTADAIKNATSKIPARWCRHERLVMRWSSARWRDGARWRPPAARAPHGDAARGEKRFVDCAACHTLEKGVQQCRAEPARRVPAQGRRARRLPLFAGAKRSGITWTAQTLDTFIADPQMIVPANRMPYAGMTDAADRADLIAYLQKASK